MLDSVYIKNYRNLKSLRINSLGRVNVITGRNNTGKSTLLEAIAIYAAKGDMVFIKQLLRDRGENYRQLEESKTFDKITAFSSLFTDRIVGFSKEYAIAIGSINESSSEKNVSLLFVKYSDEIQKDSQGVATIKQTLLKENDENKQINAFKVGLRIKFGKNAYVFPLTENSEFTTGIGRIILGNPESCQFIKTNNIDREINGKLWDNIALTEKEAFVIEALKIIEPLTERITFIERPQRERTVVIKLSDSANVVPLRSMGDGINRILTIILALVNSDNGFLLIDEFENGLHYTVQKQLWNIIFNLSKKLNVQVFVTTHSEDSISTFESILNINNNSLDGKLIRLDNLNGIINHVEFNANELKIANTNNIEIR